MAPIVNQVPIQNSIHWVRQIATDLLLPPSDSTIGHDHRRKQAHHEHHDWIRIRRGSVYWRQDIPFLPMFSLSYTR